MLSARQIGNKVLCQNRTLFRNDCGMGYQGGRGTIATREGVVPVKRGELVIVNPHRFTYGLAPGSGDFVGWEPVVVTEDMVGKTLAVFKSIEVKTEHDSLSPRQRAWNKALRVQGGIVEVWKARGDEIDVMTGEVIE